jgi:hypothetical protein
MYEPTLAEYFANLGVDINGFTGSDGLAQAVKAGQQNINASQLSRIAGYPELTATGAPMRSARGTYWAVPTAQGMRYITPETFTGPGGSGGDGASFTDALNNSSQKPWTVQNGDDGYYYAKGANPTQARYSGAGLGLSDEWGGSNAYYNVYDQAPEEAYYKIQKESDGFFDGLIDIAGPLMSVYGAGLGISGAMNGWLGSLSGLNPASIWQGSSFPGLEGMSGFDAAGNLADASWGVNPANGGGMDWYEEFLQSIGIDPSSTQFGNGGGFTVGDGVIPDVTIPSSWGSNGYPSTGIFQNGMPGGGLPFGGDIVVDGVKMPLSQFYGNPLGLSPSQLSSLPGGGNLLKALGGGGGGSLLGAGLGGLLGALGGGNKPAGNVTTTQDIPDWLKPYVMGNLNDAAIARQNLLGTNGQVMDAATPEYLKTVNGGYLDPSTNPWLEKTYDMAAGKVGSGVDSRFSAAGRYGSGAHQGVLQEGFNNLATSIYGGNYQQERTRQAAATTGAPAFSSGSSAAAYAPYIDYSRLFPNVRSQSEPYFTNPMGGILSGAAAGSQIGKLF